MSGKSIQAVQEHMKNDPLLQSALCRKKGDQWFYAHSPSDGDFTFIQNKTGFTEDFIKNIITRILDEDVEKTASFKKTAKKFKFFLKKTVEEWEKDL